MEFLDGLRLLSGFAPFIWHMLTVREGLHNVMARGTHARPTPTELQLALASGLRGFS